MNSPTAEQESNKQVATTPRVRDWIAVPLLAGVLAGLPVAVCSVVWLHLFEERIPEEWPAVTEDLLWRLSDLLANAGMFIAYALWFRQSFVAIKMLGPALFAFGLLFGFEHLFGESDLPHWPIDASLIFLVLGLSHLLFSPHVATRHPAWMLLACLATAGSSWLVSSIIALLAFPGGQGVEYFYWYGYWPLHGYIGWLAILAVQTATANTTGHGRKILTTGSGMAILLYFVTVHVVIPAVGRSSVRGEGPFPRWTGMQFLPSPLSASDQELLWQELSFASWKRSVDDPYHTWPDAPLPDWRKLAIDALVEAEGKKAAERLAEVLLAQPSAILATYASEHLAEYQQQQAGPLLMRYAVQGYRDCRDALQKMDEIKDSLSLLLDAIRGDRTNYSINFFFTETNVGATELRYLTELEAVNAVVLSRQPIGDEELQLLTSNLSDVKFWALNDTAITDVGLNHLREQWSIGTLLLRNTAITDAGMEHLQHLFQLQVLDLSDTSITDEGLKSIAHLRQLEELKLVKLPLRGAGLKYLRELDQLNTLALGHTLIDDAALRELAPLVKLRLLKLEHTAVTDEGIKHLEPLDLEALLLTGTKVTDRCIDSLLKLKRLRHLNLEGTQVSEQGIARLWALQHLLSVIRPDGEFMRFPREKAAEEDSLSEQFPVLESRGS